MPGNSWSDTIRIAQVLPIDSSQDAQGYTYRVPTDLVPSVRLGQLVNIPLRNDEVQGIVAHLADVEAENGAPELKGVTSIAELEPIFHPGQVRAMLQYAEKHAIHIHKVVSLFFPAPIRNRIAKYGLAASDSLKQEPLESAMVLPELVFFPKPENVIAEAAGLLGKPGTVVIAPSDIFTEKVLDAFSGDREKTGIFDSRMTDTGRAKFWIDALSQKYDSLIWTRRLVTYNLAQFQTIVFLEDTLFRELLHSFHRYHALELLASSLQPGQRLLIYSSTPSIETMSLALAKKINFSTRS